MKKKKKSKVILIFILIGIILFGYLGYRVYKDFFNNPAEKKQIDSIGLYGYTLNDKDTKIYKTTFKELSNVLNTTPIDYESYAKLESRLFLMDLFTLNNKLGSTDIGGLEFVHKDLRDNFKENMGANMYNNIEINIDGNRTQKLPEVSDVEITNIIETKYKYNKVEYDGYLVNATISYVEDMGYQTKIKLTLINDNNILYIVKGE